MAAATSVLQSIIAQVQLEVYGLEDVSEVEDTNEEDDEEEVHLLQRVEHHPDEPTEGLKHLQV